MSTPDTPPPHDQQLLLRACANALWPLLRKRYWRPRKITRSISPTGNPRGHHYSTGHIPTPEPTLDVLLNDPYIEAITTADETRLGYGLAISLTRADANTALARAPAAVAAAYEEALDMRILKFQRPFTWEIDRYRRNRELPRTAALGLLAVANAAIVTRLTTEQETTLYDDAAPVVLAEIEDAVERGRA